MVPEWLASRTPAAHRKLIRNARPRTAKPSASVGNAKDAAFLATFFRTGPGEYGEGDLFIARVPAIRKVAQEFKALPLSETMRLLHSKIHEERLAALAILVLQTARGDAEIRKRVYDAYLANTRTRN